MLRKVDDEGLDFQIRMKKKDERKVEGRGLE